MKKLALLLSLVLLFASCSTAPATPKEEMSPVKEDSTATIETDPATESPAVDSSKTLVTLGEKIMVNGEDISEDAAAPVYLQSIREIHPDVATEYSDLNYSGITITQSGTYEFSGELENSQIRVDAPDTDGIHIILNGVIITNPVAPGVYVMDALDKDTPGDGSVILTLAPDSDNSVSASHIGTYYLDPEETQKVKNDGAISSNVSLIIDGTGYLHITSDKEGIEVKNHLTINGGHLDIDAMDDSINASEDGVSHITINGGTVYAKSILGEEGDGIDSNGYITINGGNIITVGHPTSMDSGLDSDLGIAINGGTVVATGNMYDEILSTSKQQFLHMVFSTAQPKSTLVVVTDENDNPVFAYNSLVNFSQITISDEDFSDGNHRVYIGGEIEGTLVDGLYTQITSYTPGVLQQNTGTGAGGFGGGPGGAGGPGGPGGTPPEMPEGGTPPERPQGEETPPQGSPTGDPMLSGETSGEATTVFLLDSENHIYNGVSPASS